MTLDLAAIRESISRRQDDFLLAGSSKDLQTPHGSDKITILFRSDFFFFFLLLFFFT